MYYIVVGESIIRGPFSTREAAQQVLRQIGFGRIIRAW